MMAKRWMMVLVALFGFLTSVYPTAKPVVKYHGIEHGLSNNYVTAIFQDSHGFMWFGTQSGLNRYDGYQFKVYNHKPGNSMSLTDNRITDITQDAFGRIWIATKKGASILDGRGNIDSHLTYRGKTDTSTRAIDFAINGWCT